MRLSHTEIEAIDHIVEMSEFKSRNECVRYLLQPSLVQFVEAINTKSTFKAGIKKISAEMDLQARLKLASKNANKNAQIEIPGIDEIDIQVSPA